MKTNWIQLADEYDDRDWPFSSAFAWEKALAEQDHPLVRIRYADQLRLSGNHRLAERILEELEPETLARDPDFPNAHTWLEDFHQVEALQQNPGPSKN
ncbi:MAG: hypothetical protein AAFW73_22975 [Bacteroidota bacterium]